jgi:type II secretory pathway component GspD/PulD (secretin)/tetratricopeptide (TPR) repeat protein
MPHQVAKRKWTTLAARLLLVPVVSGAAFAGSAVAQTKPAVVPSATAPAASADPKGLVKQGYEALKLGQFDKAQECASAAAAQKGFKWGLFDDTPDGLMKAVEVARGKADKAKSEQLLKDARAVYAKKAATAEERWANLEQATTLAYQAKNLHGSYAWYDFGDKPDSLLAEIEASRGKLRKQNPNLGTTIAKGPAPAAATGSALKPGTSTTGGKAECAALLADCRKLIKAGQPVEAASKAQAARQLATSTKVVFAPSDDTPEACLQACQAEGKRVVDSLVTSADGMMAKKDTAKAEAGYAKAVEIGNALGLYTGSIQTKLLAVKAPASGAMPPVAPTMPSATTVAAGVPAMPAMVPGSKEFLVPAAPSVPTTPAVSPVMPTLQTPPTQVAGGSHGKQLLAQAEFEVKKNDLDTARRLAMQAFESDPACRTDAQAMLRTIDAESTARKSIETKDAFAAAAKAYHAKQYGQAATLFKLIDPALLPAEKREQMAQLMAVCNAEMAGGVVQVGGQEQPGVARVPNGQPGLSLAEQQQTVSELKFAALRTEGNKAISDAMRLFGKGDTDVAMQMLADFTNKVKTSELSGPKQQLLIAPVEARASELRILKHNKDFITKEMKDKKDAKDLIVGRSLADQQKQDEIAKSVRKINELSQGGKLKEAEALALRTKQLDPDNPQLEVIYTMAKRKSRIAENKRIDDLKEENFYQNALRDDPGPVVTPENPLSVNAARTQIANMRGDGISVRTRTPAEIELDRRLDVPISVDFQNASVREIVGKLRDQTKLNIAIDEVAIKDAGLVADSATVHDLKLDNVSLRTVLELALGQAKLNFINEKGVLLVTTKQRSLGRMATKVFSVMELVTPIPDFALAPHQNLNTALQQGKAQMPWESSAYQQQMAGGNLRTPQGGLNGGQLVSPGNPNMGSYNPELVTGREPNPLGASTTMAPSLNRSGAAEKLQNLIKYMVQPNAWEENGGPGRIKYFDAGAALVVNQTADVIGEVSDLLESLRRLQDLSVAVEVRVVSLSDAFFERIGMDFNLNVKTNNASFERQVGSGVFNQAPFINDINARGVTVGYSPATGFTPDLGVPVRSTSYSLSQPPFGGYQNMLSPTLNGGLSVGLAFLNDIQVYAFLEAAAGDRRTNIMQAPKITLFNGQTSTVTVSDYAYFTTGVTAFNFGGQVVFQPTNSAIPIGNAVNPFSGLSGVSVTVQAVISADRRFVRLNMAPQLSGLTSANVPLFPVTVFITPVFEGGSQGQPIPFTQFYQQPSFSQIEVQTTVSVPDGGTVLLGGLKAMSEGRSEYGPPVISQIPYLNRLFKNVGIGRETRHIMIMVTPRIIINSEEEVTQTGSK